MTTTPTTLYTALLAAQRDFGAVTKNKQNPHLKNFYADLGAVLEAVTEPLANHGLLIVQRFNHNERGPVLITEIVHAATGDKVASELPIVTKDPTDPQKLGGAITYARRYSLLAILSLTAEDDDGNAASQPRQQQRAPAAPPRPQPAAVPATSGQPIDVVLADLRDMDEANEPYAVIVQQAREQGARFDEVTRERINEAVRKIQERRKAAKQPASFAG